MNLKLCKMIGKNTLYYNTKIDFRSISDLRALIAQLDEVINELHTNALSTVAGGNIAEYELDTGQTKTRIKYNTVASVISSIEAYENLRQMYINMIENKTFGRVTQLVDQSNFRTR